VTIVLLILNIIATFVFFQKRKICNWPKDKWFWRRAAYLALFGWTYPILLIIRNVSGHIMDIFWSRQDGR
jgi:hypothetical protein